MKRLPEIVQVRLQALPMLIGLCLFLMSCTAEKVAVEPVPPPREDLSAWSVPEVVQPQKIPVVRPASQRERKPTKAEQVASFAEGTPAFAPVAVGTPLDIVLEQGEEVLFVVGGDRLPQEGGQTPRWEVKKGYEGQGDTLRPHLFITVTEPGLSTGFTITTTRRTYLVTCQSVGASLIRVLRWTYTASTTTSFVTTKDPALLPDPSIPAKYHAGYEVQSNGRPPDWFPRHVLDDGKRIYIVYPEVSLFGVVPLVRMIGGSGPQLVNTRQLYNVVIVDQLAARLELRVGVGEEAETVRITRGNLRTITCPGDGDCPQWPQAAQALQRSAE